MGRAIPSLTQRVFTAWCLVKHRDNLYLLPLSKVYEVAFLKNKIMELAYAITLLFSPCYGAV